MNPVTRFFVALFIIAVSVGSCTRLYAEEFSNADYAMTCVSISVTVASNIPQDEKPELYQKVKDHGKWWYDAVMSYYTTKPEAADLKMRIMTQNLNHGLAEGSVKWEELVEALMHCQDTLSASTS